jgi:hypothetical protein
MHIHIVTWSLTGAIPFQSIHLPSRRWTMFPDHHRGNPLGNTLSHRGLCQDAANWTPGSFQKPAHSIRLQCLRTSPNIWILGLHNVAVIAQDSLNTADDVKFLNGGRITKIISDRRLLWRPDSLAEMRSRKSPISRNCAAVSCSMDQ